MFQEYRLPVLETVRNNPKVTICYFGEDIIDDFLLVSIFKNTFQFLIGISALMTATLPNCHGCWTTT